MSSLIANKVERLLREAFPLLQIQKEHFVKYNGQRLFVDFFIPAYLIAVEVHGRQHDVFVEHFHKDGAGWREHKKRDSVKEEWAETNNITYVVIRESNMPETKNELLELIRGIE